MVISLGVFMVPFYRNFATVLIYMIKCTTKINSLFLSYHAGLGRQCDNSKVMHTLQFSFVFGRSNNSINNVCHWPSSNFDTRKSQNFTFFWSNMILTHWGRDKMDAISQTTCSSAFSGMKMFEFRLRFHWSLFRRVQLTIIQHWFR